MLGYIRCIHIYPYEVIIRLHLESAKVTLKIVRISKSCQSNWPSWVATVCYQSNHGLGAIHGHPQSTIYCVLGRGVGVHTSRIPGFYFFIFPAKSLSWMSIGTLFGKFDILLTDNGSISTWTTYSNFPILTPWTLRITTLHRKQGEGVGWRSCLALGLL